MKKILLKPGYEFIFTLSLLAIFGLPPLVFAQSTKDVQINISNGDTTVNGKNIKNLSPKERKEALKDIVNIDNSAAGTGSHRLMVQRMQTVNGTDTSRDMVIEKTDRRHPPMMADGDMGPGSESPRLRFRKGVRSDSTFANNYRMNGGPADRRKIERFNDRDDRPMKEFGRKNTQNFSYVNTDSQGISTHVSYHVSEPTGAINHGLADDGNPQFDLLDLKDLTLVPQFEAGKTVISFSLPSKTVAEVQFKDSENNIIWSQKVVNGEFTKAFDLGLNGIYYLHVKQGGKLAVKKIMKD